MEHGTCGCVELATAKERYDDMEVPRSKPTRSFPAQGSETSHDNALRLHKTVQTLHL